MLFWTAFGAIGTTLMAITVAVTIIVSLHLSKSISVVFLSEFFTESINNKEMNKNWKVIVHARDSTGRDHRCKTKLTVDFFTKKWGML